MGDGQRWHHDNVPAARRLRQRMTPSERAVWEVVRAKRFHGLKFRRQHPIGPFVVDFFCDHLRLIVEIDGAVHDDAVQAVRDREREALLRRVDDLGYDIVRITADDAIADPRGALQLALTHVLAAPPRRRLIGPELPHRGRDDP